MADKKNTKPLIVLTAGGTGGHVFPAESLAEELSVRGYNLALVTDSRGKNNYHGKLGEITNYSVCAGALVGKSKLFKIKSLFKTCIGIIQASIILLKHKPVCVVGFGGYASFPCSMAAILLGIDLVIHEQNSVMSRTNRFLGKYATFIAQSFQQTKYAPFQTPNILTGMPIRQSITELHKRTYMPKNKNNKFRILIIGGSQGAKIFGDIIPEAIKKLPAELQKDIQIFHQCRKDDCEHVKNNYTNCNAEINISHFFSNMAELYSETSLIISRAGASSITEITAAKIPSILIPLPTAADNHQEINAQTIANNNAGIIINQNNLSADSLAQKITDFLQNEDQLKIMSEQAGKICIIDSSNRLADNIEQKIIYT